MNKGLKLYWLKMWQNLAAKFEEQICPNNGITRDLKIVIKTALVVFTWCEWRFYVIQLLEVAYVKNYF